LVLSFQRKNHVWAEPKVLIKKGGFVNLKLVNGVKGNCYKVKNIKLEPVVKRRLEMLGMTEYSDVILLNKKKSGAVIIKVRGTRFALGKEFAEGIEIGGDCL